MKTELECNIDFDVFLGPLAGFDALHCTIKEIVIQVYKGKKELD